MSRKRGHATAIIVIRKGANVSEQKQNTREVGCTVFPYCNGFSNSFFCSMDCFLDAATITIEDG